MNRLLLTAMCLGVCAGTYAEDAFPTSIEVGKQYTGAITVTVEEKDSKIQITAGEVYTTVTGLTEGGKYYFEWKVEGSDLNGCNQVALQSNMDGNWSWHADWLNDGFKNSYNDKVVVEYKNTDVTPQIKVIPADMNSNHVGQLTYTLTLKVTEYAQLTPKGNALYNDDTGKSTDEEWSSALKIGVKNGWNGTADEGYVTTNFDYSYLTEGCVFYVTYTSEKAPELVMSSGVRGSWIKVQPYYTENGIAEYIYDDIVKAWGSNIFYSEDDSADNLKVLNIVAGGSALTVTAVHFYTPASTAIADVEASDTEVVSTTYYSLTGVASQTPVKGINIVKQVLTDGSMRVTKMIK